MAQDINILFSREFLKRIHGDVRPVLLEWKAADQIAHLREVMRVIAYGNWSTPTIDSDAANTYAKIVAEMQRLADAALSNT